MTWRRDYRYRHEAAQQRRAVRVAGGVALVLAGWLLVAL